MKKKHWVLIVLGLLVVGGVFVWSKGNKNTTKDVETYLEEFYPEETFEIRGSEEIEINAEKLGKVLSGHQWEVYSEVLDLTFDVYEDYQYNYNTGIKLHEYYFRLKDDYAKKAFEVFAKENADDRVKYESKGLTMWFDEVNFENKEEMAQYIFDLVTKLKEMTPFKYNYSRQIGHIYVEGITDKVGFLRTDQIESIEDVKEYLNN